MNPAEVQPYQLMQRMADFFEAEGIAYRVVGSMASMIYGEPRFTIDVDIVADIPLAKVDRFCQHFAAPADVRTGKGPQRHEPRPNGSSNNQKGGGADRHSQECPCNQRT